MTWITDLEWANYAATQPAADATPGLELVMRDDLIITRSDLLPLPDANHACLLRSDAAHLDARIDEIIDTFQPRGMSSTFYLSPGCEPEELPARLVARGFVAQRELEAWMTLSALPSVDVPAPSPGIAVRTITRDEAGLFAGVFLDAFEMPKEFAPTLEQLLRPSIGLDNARHYMAFSQGTAVGTLSLLLHERFGIIGSAGVTPSRNSRGAAMNMIIAAVLEAQRLGCTTLMLQTTAGTGLERLLRIKGWRRAFTRTCFMSEETEVLTNADDRTS